MIDNCLNSKDLVLVKFEGGNAQTMLLSELIGDKNCILLYFSAHWCPPCRKFTPLLAEGYKNSTKNNYDMIFISHDRSEHD